MAGGDCDWDGEGSGTGPLGIDYVQAYHCGFREHGWLFYPFLLGWGCFITYLSASYGWSIGRHVMVASPTSLCLTILTTPQTRTP